MTSAEGKRQLRWQSGLRPWYLALAVGTFRFSRTEQPQPGSGSGVSLRGLLVTQDREQQEA